MQQAAFDRHVEETILKYGDLLKPFNLQKFNSNLIDPIKLIFDKAVYGSSWDEIVKNEIFRQRDKSGNNSIGYFHQNMFKMIPGCKVPKEGWDVIYHNPDGITTPDGEVVHTIYVEMKNKHNTMNSASAAKTYIKMQGQLLRNDDCACYLVEAIAKRSQDITWKTTVDKETVQHRRIRRCSLDQFYAKVTGDDLAFFKICTQLPASIKRVLAGDSSVKTPDDSVSEELRRVSTLFTGETDDLAIAMAVYMLGFGTYNGFQDYLPDSIRNSKKPTEMLCDYAARSDTL